MRRKVKFQSVLHEDRDDISGSSVGLNSLLNGSSNSRKRASSHPIPIPRHEDASSTFSDNRDDIDEDASKSISSAFSLRGGNRLYGRSVDQSRLHHAYRQIWSSTHGSKPSVQLALVSGSAGCGKTALATFLKETVIEDGGFFLQGKFDQMQSAEPYGPFVSAFSEMVEQIIMKGPATIDSMKKSILNAVHLEQRILTAMIPALEAILGPQHSDTLKGFRQGSAEVCFKFVFRMFVRAVSSLDNPIVLLLDDLHHADDASLDLLRALVSDCNNDGVLFIGTYRENRVTVYMDNKIQVIQ
jgi:predicted ATPase